MDLAGTHSTIKPQDALGGDDKLTPYITIVVLVAGVAGGLILVISVILFCKYCITRKKGLQRYRRPTLFKRPSPERVHRPYLHYESLESSAASGEASPAGAAHHDRHKSRTAPSAKNCSTASSISAVASTSGGVAPTGGATGAGSASVSSARTDSPGSRKTDVEEEESIDDAVARYISQKADEEKTSDDIEAAGLITPPPPAPAPPPVSSQQVQIQIEGEEVARSFTPPHSSSTQPTQPTAHRHRKTSSTAPDDGTITTPVATEPKHNGNVPFSKSQAPPAGKQQQQQQARSPSGRQPSSTMGRRVSVLVVDHKRPAWKPPPYRRRYTETDFHHLKLLKVDKSQGPSKITKQRSWGHPVQDSRERCVVHPLSRSVDAVPPPGPNGPQLNGAPGPLSNGRGYHDEKPFPRHNEKPISSYRCVNESPSPPLKLPIPQIISVEVHQDAPHVNHPGHIHRKSFSGSGGVYTSGKSLPIRPDNAAMRRASYSSACRRDTMTTSSVSRFAPNYCSQSAMYTSKYPELFARPSSPPKALEVQSYRRRHEERRHSHSLEIAPSRLMVPNETRRVRSFEGELHQMYDYRGAPPPPQTQVYNASYERMSEHEGSQELQSKVRYNDTGSFEEVNDDVDFFLDEIEVENLSIDVGEGTTSDETPDVVTGPQKYRDIWNLRATLEEEEDFSDTIRMEDMTSPEEHSEDQDRNRASSSHTTSFESNTEPVPSNEHSPSEGLSVPSMAGCHGSHLNTGSDALLHPNYESRRHTYRSILSNGNKPRSRPPPVPRKGDNSFDSIDSVDTIDTNGGSDTSRPEVTSTSFESTTDNTDSTGEGQMHRLQQMRGDSGYKSLEKQSSLPPEQPNYEQGLAPPGQKKHIQFKIDDGKSYEQDITPGLIATPSSEDGSQIHMATHVGYSPTEDKRENHSQKSSVILHFERRSAKTASRKRRDYKKERRAPQPHPVYDAETDSRSDHLSGDSFEETHHAPKLSVFSRFIRSQSREHRHHNHHHHQQQQQLARDYSIDQKTDAIFHEFLRFDPALETKKTLSARVRQRNRLNRKHTEPSMDIERKRRLVPEMRSASVGSDSSNEANKKRLSMQDSIEDEYIEQHANVHNRAVSRQKSLVSGGGNIHDNIPMIRLPEDDHSPSSRLIYQTVAH